jgi:hypothetical protein
MISITAIDATGFTIPYTSDYRSRKIGELQRNFLKTSISVDIAKKVALGWKISQKIYYEIKHANVLIKQSNRIQKSQYYVMGKGREQSDSLGF